MIALLSGAWWAQRLTGITAQAVGLAVAVAVALALVVGGLWWLRHDARADERAGWSTRLANARAQDAARLLIRQRASEAVGAKAAKEWGDKLADAERARAELEAKLEKLTKRPVCFTADMVGVLNR